MDDSKPIFLQVAEQIENDILDGSIAEEDQVPSTNEISAFYRINPATAGKGVNLLVERGILYKKRGIGMFVSTGARGLITQNRKAEFREEYLIPLLTEAEKLGIDTTQLIELINKENNS
ncbi:MAG: GntR family transcriptional regulator [Microbacteriaceae bacterium]